MISNTGLLGIAPYLEFKMIRSVLASLVVAAFATVCSASDVNAQNLRTAAWGTWKGTMTHRSNTCGLTQTPVENFSHRVTAESYAAFITEQSGLRHSCYANNCLSFSRGEGYIRGVIGNYLRVSPTAVALQAIEYIGIRNDRATIRRTLVFYEVDRSGRLTGQNCSVTYVGTGRRVSR